MVGTRRHRRRRSRWGWLPTKGELAKIGTIAAIVGAPGTWWASTKPDPRTSAVASLAVTGAETDAAMAESLAAIRRELVEVNRRLRLVERPREHVVAGTGSPAPATAAPPDSVRYGLGNAVRDIGTAIGHLWPWRKRDV